jgi:excisionase family DNA binding protein
MTTDKRYTAAEAAEWLHVSVDQVYKLTREGELGYRQVGSKKIYPESELRAFDERTFVPAVVSIDEHRHRSRQAA